LLPRVGGGHLDRVQGAPTMDAQMSELWYGAAHVVGLAVLYKCCRCCGRRFWSQGADAPGGGADAKYGVEHLQPRKHLSTSYALWLASGPCFAHLFYLERIIHGLVAVCTFNFFGVGWALDALLLPYYVRSFNASRTAEIAPYDTSRRRLFCHLPMYTVAVAAILAAIFVAGPSALHATGIVDVDRLAAQTERNPYEVLGVSRTADLQEARAAYRKESLRWHPDRNVGCGTECETKMSEITKAFELIRKRHTPNAEDKTWASALDGLGKKWMHVLEVLLKDSNNGAGETRTDL